MGIKIAIKWQKFPVYLCVFLDGELKSIVFVVVESSLLFGAATQHSLVFTPRSHLEHFDSLLGQGRREKLKNRKN